MQLDHYVTLGRSGLRVSPLCLGAMTFGEDLGWGTPVKESEQIIDRFLELGGNFIDTANFYTKSPLREDPWRPHRPPQGQARPSGHCHEVQRQPVSGDPNGGGSSRKSIIAACENSLRRLQTDYIDLYWLHNWDVHTPIAETMAALEDLVRSGKVRYLGVSDTPAWKVARGERHGALPRLVRFHRPADRVFIARAHGRAGTDAHGQGTRSRRDTVVGRSRAAC